MKFIQANWTCRIVDLKCESAAKSIVLTVFYPKNMVPLWCTCGDKQSHNWEATPTVFYNS